MRKDLVFIASGGRTGTQFFGNMLKTVIDDCWSEHEPDMLEGLSALTLARIHRFGLWHMVFGRVATVTGVRPLGHRLLTGAMSEEKCAHRLRQSRIRYHATIREPLVVESYSRWWMFAGRIHRIWPGAKTVGIIRDPRTWIVSWLRHNPRCHNGNWKDLFPPGPLTPQLLGETEWAARWEMLGPYGKLAWDWRTIYSNLDRASAENAPDVRLFRFEDLFDPDHGAMRELVEFITDHGARKYRVHDLKGFAASVRNASSGPRREWPDWTADEARLLDELCGPLMRRYGYGVEPEWQEKLAMNTAARIGKGTQS